MTNQLQNGLICRNCSSRLKDFHTFKTEILRIRTSFQDEHTSKKKLPAAIVPRSLQKLAIGRETKVTSLLKQYNVQLASDCGKATKSPKIICPLCGKILTANAFPVHLKGHQGGREQNFLCEVCSQKYSSNSELVIHKRSVFSFRFSQWFSSPFHFLFRRHSKEKPFQCDHCEKRFFNCKKNLIHHLRVAHLNMRKPQLIVECNLCLKKLKLENLERHKRKSHPNGVDDGIKVNSETDHYHCVICSGQFLTKRAHDAHFCALGANDGPSQNQCVVCTTKFKSRLDAVKHLQDVHAERIDETKWKCLVCKTIVASKIILHIESVHTTLGSKCEFCDKELKNRRCLR